MKQTEKETKTLAESRFAPGTVWFIKRYNFGQGIETRDKYCIVLKVDEESEMVCFCLVTSRKRYGESEKPSHGCRPGWVSYYHFAEGHPIGELQHFAFELPTHVYHAHDLYLEHFSNLEIYHIDNRVFIEDKLYECELVNFLHCALGSRQTKRKVKRFLQADS